MWVPINPTVAGTMNTQSLILAILNFGDASGYEIKKQSTDGAFSFFVDISYGSIYPTLARLEKEGLVSCRSESQTGKPDKKVYSITDTGRQEFLRTLATPPQQDKFKSEFLLVAMCADMTSPETIKSAVDGHIREIESIKAKISELSSECDHPATLWIARYGEHVMQAKLEFLEKNRNHLIAMAGSGLSINQAAE